MNINLLFVRETNLARLYRNKEGKEVWIPRSVVNHTRKWPLKEGDLYAVHELQVEDWWANKKLGGFGA